jgi:hypothetical protein
MIDLVDNLIDASPKSRADLYEKSSFALKVKTTQFEKKENENKSEENLSLDLVSEMDCSVGILKYGSGDVYEG